MQVALDPPQRCRRRIDRPRPGLLELPDTRLHRIWSEQ